MEKTILKINSMVCGGCAATVQKALLAVEGVAEAHVSHAENRAEVSFDSAKTQPSALLAAVQAAGYEAAL